MIIGPFGVIVAECRSSDNSFVTAIITSEKLMQADAARYIQVRRPELDREIIGRNHQSEQKVVWLESGKPL